MPYGVVWVCVGVVWCVVVMHGTRCVQCEMCGSVWVCVVCGVWCGGVHSVWCADHRYQIGLFSDSYFNKMVNHFKIIVLL